MPLFTLVLWGLATLLTLLLLGRSIALSQYREFPCFFLYLAVNLCQTAVGLVLYQGYGFGSSFAYPIIWTTQGIVVVARALAAAEVCHQVLGSYKGIWALAARVLALSGVLVLSLSLYFGRRSYHVGIITLEISLEAGIATCIAGLFLFARYYQIRVQPATGLVGLGLGLLSCFKILNDLVFERFLKINGVSWNYASSFSFVGILLIWTWALRQPVAARLTEPKLKSALVYANLIPQVNRQLAELNEQLTQLWHVESPKS